MNTDECTREKSKSETLKILKTTTSSSLSAIAATSRIIPVAKDLHFYANFPEFGDPLRRLSAKSQFLLDRIGSSSDHILTKNLQFPSQTDIDDAYDWLVNINDEIYERFDSSIDEFERLKKGVESEEGGFQLVYGKKSKKKMKENEKESEKGSGVSVKAKVSFHIASIKRPQDEFNILVNNTNQPFQHVWLERSEDGSRFVHPLEKLSVMDFVDTSNVDGEPVPPLPLESTPFKFVEEVKDLKELAAKLRSAKEFAVDLEHNQYRSFQGLTCLMQISTRTEDFIIDTFKLRIHVGPYLRDVFKDPTKKKVMHGADRDIIWLERDFGIYVCNMFDTGQASRVLNLERNSLEFLLQHFCGITANKQYQNADWRLRPLPDEMLRYGREDTHYLLYIYDVMRGLLLAMPKDPESSDTPLVEVYKRSYDLCMQLYEKELLTEDSYLRMYGLQDAGFNSQQLAVVAGLFEWRDGIARAEDEGTGYILPNRTLLEIAKQMPVTASQLRRLMKSKHSYAERNLNSIVSIVRHSIQNAAAFEAVAQQLKEAAAQKLKEGHRISEINEENEETLEADTITSSENELAAVGQNTATHIRKEPLDHGDHVGLTSDRTGTSFKNQSENIQVRDGISSLEGEIPKESLPISAKFTGATVEVKKKPTGAFGAMLGSTASKRKLDTRKMETELMKLEEKIKSSVSFQFSSFMGKNEQPKPVDKSEPARPNSSPPPLPADVPATMVSQMPHPEESQVEPTSSSSVEEIIVIGDSSSGDEVEKDNSETATLGTEEPLESAVETDEEDESVSLSDLSSSFQKCFESNNQNKNTTVDKSPEPSGLLNLKPFDYDAARKQVKFGEDASGDSEADGDRSQMSPLDSVGNKKASASGHSKNGDEVTEFSQGRRRQAFPASGNRSATFR